MWRDTASSQINQALAGQFKSHKISGFVQGIGHLSHRLSLVLGCRADYYEINHQLTVSPRANLSYLWSDKTTLRRGNRCD